MRSSSLGRGVLSVLLLTGAAAAQAQTGVARVVVKVPFQFTLGDKTLPAGSYSVESRADLPTLSIRSADGAHGAAVPVITRLARIGGAEKGTTARFVFDLVGGKSFLSEVWFPGEDGYLVRATTEKHQHDIESGETSGASAQKSGR